MDWNFFHELLSIDSTSGKERKVAEWLAGCLPALFPETNRPVLRVDEVGDGTLNLLLTWGTPRIVFCTHLDTVPPYIAPTFPERWPVAAGHDESLAVSHDESLAAGHDESLAVSHDESLAVSLDDSLAVSHDENIAAGHDESASVIPGEMSSVIPGLTSSVIPGLTRNLSDIIRGRGACDAKGQVFAMVTACQRLAELGSTDFGLLLLSGEETGSWGAKAFAKTDFKAEYLVVGEPTDNCMVSASKGTKSFDLKFTGEAFHSGYPQYGVSAVNLFVEFVNALKAKDFGMDPVFGETTWNIGLVHSDNPQNILSPELTCRLYFRTTFVSDEAVCRWMAEAPGLLKRWPVAAGHDEKVAAGHDEPASSVIPGLTRNLSVTPRGGDRPARYWTVPGLPAKAVAFGSDAPHLKGFTHKAICGPGSITVAHRDDECVRAADLAAAVEQYITLYRDATKE